ncbi:MAG: helix-turn-helix domain-containing protein, partial [Kiritimatiellia bacterium]
MELQQKILSDILKSLRIEAGLDPDELSEILQRDQGYIHRLEKGEEKVGLVDFHSICESMGKNSHEVFSMICDRLA